MAVYISGFNPDRPVSPDYPYILRWLDGPDSLGWLAAGQVGFLEFATAGDRDEYIQMTSDASVRVGGRPYKEGTDYALEESGG